MSEVRRDQVHPPVDVEVPQYQKRRSGRRKLWVLEYRRCRSWIGPRAWRFWGRYSSERPAREAFGTQAEKERGRRRVQRWSWRVLDAYGEIVDSYIAVDERYIPQDVEDDDD